MRVGFAVAAVATTLAGGCETLLVEDDGIYSRAAEPVLCGLNIDDKNGVSLDAFAAGLDRAQVERQVLHLYAHQPTQTVEAARIEVAFAGAADRGIPFVTYRDIVDGGGTGAGLAFSFDDRDIAGWDGLRPVFARYGARATFFITRFNTLTPEERAVLHLLASEGHDIEYHSTAHLDAVEQTGALGPAGYIERDILPDLALMRADGFDPRVFAYPYGSRSRQTDEALLGVFPMLRASSFACPR